MQSMQNKYTKDVRSDKQSWKNIHTRRIKLIYDKRNA